MMRIKNNYIKNIYIFIFGFMGMSSLGQYFVLDVLKLPFSLMEIYYLPLIFIYRNIIYTYIKKYSFKQNLFSIFILIFILTSILTAIIKTGTFFVLFEYRSIIYMILIIDIIKKSKLNINLRIIYLISIMAILGELVYVLFISKTAIVSSTNCIAIAIAIITSFIAGKYLRGIMIVLICLLLTINTGFRLGIIITIVSAVESIIYISLFKYNKIGFKWLKNLTFISIFVYLGLIFVQKYQEIINFIADFTGMSSFAVFRITSRLESLLKLDFISSQDTYRFEIYSFIIDRFSTSILPRGLVGSYIGEYWLYIDVPMIYLYDIFGSIFSFIIITFLSIKTLKLFIIIRKYKLEEKNEVILLLMPVMFLLLILNGSFIVIVFQAILCAIIIGILIKNAGSLSNSVAN